MMINYLQIRGFILVTFLCLLLMNCNNKNKHKINESEIVIPDSIYSFFPKQDALCLKTYSTETNAENNMRTGGVDVFLDSYFFKVFSYSCNNCEIFENQINSYESKAIDNFSPIDSCYFII